MSMRDLLGKLARIDESMTSAAKKPAGPEFPGYWKGTDRASKAKDKMVGGSAEESILRDLSKALTENPKSNPHVLMREYQEFKQDVAEGSQFNSKQEVIAHFVRQGKTAAQGAAAWERGFRGKQTPSSMNNFKFKKPAQKHWQELDEYGGVGGYGAASQAPAGTTAQNPDPAQKQAAADQQQIQKSTNQLAGTLNAQGAAQNLDKVKFSDTMTKLDDKPNTELTAQELQQMGPLAVATSKALQNPQTATQMKQLINKSDTLDQQKQAKVKQAQQQVGTNQPADQQTPNTQQQPGQTK